MANPICPTCGAEQKLIPAGVSKSSGKPYQAFWSCPNRCPKTSFQPKAKVDYSSLQDRKSEMIGEAQGRKEESIREAGAKRDAGLIVAAMIHSGELKSSDWFIKYQEVSGKVYNYRIPPFGD